MIDDLREYEFWEVYKDKVTLPFMADYLKDIDCICDLCEHWVTCDENGTVINDQSNEGDMLHRLLDGGAFYFTCSKTIYPMEDMQDCKEFKPSTTWDFDNPE